jgi:sugar/nucleoside kinase (ribokinase family)
MEGSSPQVVVCGHICLDVIPTFPGGSAALSDLLVPGKLINVGPALASSGGTVSNTGLALHRLGVPVRLMGKVGDDLFGRAILDIVRAHGPTLTEGMLVTQDAPTSYTIVISPPGADRVFLHCPGANDTFAADDVPYHQLSGARLFHFGYPPLMRRMYADGGGELASLLRRAREQGLVTSLDMALPDPASEAGRAPWREIMERVLPFTDVFVPSLDETLFMLGRGPAARPDATLLSDVASELLNMGASVVVLKLGAEGLYLRTASDTSKLAALAPCLAAATAAWTARELLAPCFEVEVVGTTGSGDCTVAGFLAGLLHGLPPEGAMAAAVAVGACSVEAADATSGVPTWERVQERMRSGWPRRPTKLSLSAWQWDEQASIWRGPHDQPRRRGCAAPG